MCVSWSITQSCIPCKAMVGTKFAKFYMFQGERATMCLQRIKLVMIVIKKLTLENHPHDVCRDAELEAQRR